jgi:hypothetical protein
MTQDNLSVAAATRRAIAVLRNFSLPAVRPASPVAATATEQAIPVHREFSFPAAAASTRRAIAMPRNFSFSAVAATNRKLIAMFRTSSFSADSRQTAQPSVPNFLSVVASYRVAILSVALLFVSFGFLAGCHSTFVQTTIVNHSGAPLRLVEVDYPSASFGTTNLNNAAEYHYRFKIQGSGTVKLDFVDSAGKPHHAVGPELDEGQEGTLLVTIDESNTVSWTPSFPVNK